MLITTDLYVVNSGRLSVRAELVLLAGAIVFTSLKCLIGRFVLVGIAVFMYTLKYSCLKVRLSL